jgi:phage terminase large subunit-like protein
VFEDIIDLLGGDEFEEKPVALEEFVVNEQYLGLPPLSQYQYQAIRAMSQIYKEQTLLNLYGKEDGLKRWRQTCNEVILQLGKGSGKDYMSTIAVAYIVYLLLCLKDPQRYYGKPPGDAIDILNIAINAEQAKNVFFKGFKMRLDKCPWFQGRYTTTAQSVSFDKGITCHSGHSERESWEGYNVLMVILDEISGFATESTSGHDQAKTGSAIYDMYRASVDSRFPDFGKVVLLSFPRYKNDYIQTRYNAVVVDKVVHQRSHTFKIDETIQDYTNENEKYENEFTVDWEEDEIVAYRYPRVFALRRPTWEINPTRKITDFKIQFLTNPIDALSRFACMPPEAVDAFFRSREKIETCFSGPNGVESSGRFTDWFVPKEETEYFIHVDLAQKHDHCAVSMAHVDKWVKIDTFNDYDVINPFVIVDAIRWWTPTADKTVDFKDVKNYILELRSRGFRIKLVTFDRWNSFDIMNELKSVGMNSETLSVAKKHYEDMQMLVAEERIYGPHTNLLIDELLQLRIIRDKVDHPRKGSKDLADAVCGSIYNAIVNSSRGTKEIEVHNFKDFRPSSHKDLYDEYSKPITKRPDEMPKDVADFLSGMGLI